MRCFVGSFLSEPYRSEIQRLRPEIEDVRWVRSERYHVTLEFFGALAQKDVERLLQRVESMRSSYPIVTTATTIGGFPNSERARVVVIFLDSCGQFESLCPGSHTLRPHITLAYARRKSVSVDEQRTDLDVVFRNVGLYESKAGEYIHIG